MSVYTEDRIPRYVPNLPNAPEVMAAEIARLLSPWRRWQLDEGDVLEAFATFMMDAGIAASAPRFVLYSYGVARGFFGRSVARPMSPHEMVGQEHGVMARVAHEAWRASEVGGR